MFEIPLFVSFEIWSQIGKIPLFEVPTVICFKYLILSSITNNLGRTRAVPCREENFE